jgi:hypothetical protein
VRFHTSCVVTAIEPARVLLHDTLHGDDLVLDDVDAVVLSIGNDVVDDLYHAVRAAGHEAHRVGDCLAPRGIEHAVFEAHRVARTL